MEKERFVIEVLDRMRIFQGMSKESLSVSVGRHRNWWIQVTNYGQNPSLKNIMKVANLLGHELKLMPLSIEGDRARAHAEAQITKEHPPSEG